MESNHFNIHMPYIILLCYGKSCENSVRLFPF
nr:MAG TPA: hypothetical protein [Caudoviricetes sp.]